MAAHALVRARYGLDVTSELEQLVAKLGPPPPAEDTPLMAAARAYDRAVGTAQEQACFDAWAALARAQRSAGGPGR